MIKERHMKLSIYMNDIKVNELSHCKEELIVDLFSYATKKGIVKRMKVNDYLDGYANITFTFHNNTKFVYENVPVSNGLIDIGKL